METHFFFVEQSPLCQQTILPVLLSEVSSRSSASAFRYCRHCLGSEDDIQSKFVESQFTLRTDERHSYHCDVLDRQDLSSADKQHFSLVYGVNRRALLHTLSYFSVASGALIPDIMHDVLEGALPLEVKLMLKVFVIDKKLFSLTFIDDGFKKLNLRSFDGDKPSTLSGVSLTSCDSNLHQHAMQMWTLARFLSLVIGHLIPEDDKHWENFLCLLDIIDILFSHSVADDAIGYLEALISDHHSTFLELYPDTQITMKMHSIVHMPRLTKEYGPLINHWTTRFEAKHKYFKHLANVMGNFTNICFSLALRHQMHQCYLSLNTDSLPGEEVEIGPGKNSSCIYTTSVELNRCSSIYFIF
ncbi:hypothetical protein GBAR_LOCUS26222 [Geodia barretti]|uniref:Uncharacterized protein n=1 Tax=Geodia barretti TaxID=519541 RepID=A0AA35X6R7_GEOBA|nr:hypothetical protein GBAR_LOCUS26222 [Geodia barretti]